MIRIKMMQADRKEKESAGVFSRSPEKSRINKRTIGAH